MPTADSNASGGAEVLQGKGVSVNKDRRALPPEWDTGQTFYRGSEAEKLKMKEAERREQLKWRESFGVEEEFG
jgi:hypothetical protein